MSVLAFIATEILAVKSMTAEGDARKKGRNLQILGVPCAAPPHAASKSGRGWSRLAQGPHRTVNPSQTCSACGRQERKPQAQRVHRCA